MIYYIRWSVHELIIVVEALYNFFYYCYCIKSDRRAGRMYSFPLAAHYLYRLFIKASSVGLTLLSLPLGYTQKKLARKRTKPKPSSVFRGVRKDWRSAGLIENLSPNHISDPPTRKNWVRSHWHVSENVWLFLSNKNDIHCSRPLVCPSEPSLSQELYSK